MRFPVLVCLLPSLALGSPLAEPGAPPLRATRHTTRQELDVPISNGTDVGLPEPYQLAGKAINWKLLNGGLIVARDVIGTAAASVVVVAQVIKWMADDSAKNSCAPLAGTVWSDDGKVKYHVKFWPTTTGKNCDTTAQVKTMAAAVDDSFDKMHSKKWDWGCIEYDHGGTWHGHLAVATDKSKKDVNTVCNRK